MWPRPWNNVFYSLWPQPLIFFLSYCVEHPAEDFRGQIKFEQVLISHCSTNWTFFWNFPDIYWCQAASINDFFYGLGEDVQLRTTIGNFYKPLIAWQCYISHLLSVIYLNTFPNYSKRYLSSGQKRFLVLCDTEIFMLLLSVYYICLVTLCVGRRIVFNI